ncbi:hypothetical protein BD01_0782 [Thermococcus nautili]|uniref:Uncharacterized protein n=1 Tax=Thermococcus nautili TaxID=195522 RepID=W8PJY2_9EURY|nr:hypothetical protein BD01_0782 [Thermococcus nautili]
MQTTNQMAKRLRTAETAQRVFSLLSGCIFKILSLAHWMSDVRRRMRSMAIPPSRARSAVLASTTTPAEPKRMAVFREVPPEGKKGNNDERKRGGERKANYGVNSEERAGGFLDQQTAFM